MESNVVGLGDPGKENRDALLLDYGHCNERHQAAIRRFAHKLAELDYPKAAAQILKFNSVEIEPSV